MRFTIFLCVLMLILHCALGYRHMHREDHGHSHFSERPRRRCHGMRCREQRMKQAGGRYRLDLSDAFEAARPWFQGELQLGPLFDWEWDLFGQEEQQNWWEGPNVCNSIEEKEEESAEGDIHSHGMVSYLQCDETDTHYKCVHSIIRNGMKKTITNKFECCYGYQRLGHSSGCRTRLRLTDLKATMEKLGLEETVEGLDSVALSPLLAAGNFTVFAPVDGSFDVPDAEAIEDEAINSNVIMLYPESNDLVDSVRGMLSAHVVDGFHTSGDLEDEQILETIGGTTATTIRINRYQAPKKLVTANCVPLETSDYLATNGVVHVVTALLPPVTQTLYQMIHSDPQFTILKSLISQADFGDELEQAGTMTLFAPNDAAFRKLGTSRLERLQQSGQCLKNVLRTHLLPHTICSSVIEGRARTRNLQGNYLHVSRDDSDQLLVEKAQVTSCDKMATNGVMHVIDEVILPSDALNIIEVLEDKNYTEFLQLANTTNLTNQLAGLENFTLLLPSRQAIENLDEEGVSDRDPNTLREILQYHVITDRQLRSGDLDHGRDLNTLGSSKHIAVRQYSSFPFSRTNVLTAQCARVTETVNIESCNGIAHVIDKVLIPPIGNIVDVLANDSQFSVFTDLIRESDFEETLISGGPLTVFAPTNEYMANVDVEGLKQDEDALTHFIKSHVMPEMLCCSGVFRGSFGKSALERFLGGNDVAIRRHRNDVIKVDGHVVVSCDLTATNGVVHALAGTLAVVEDDSHEIPSIFDSIFEDFDVGSNLERLLPEINFGEPERTEEDGLPWWMRRLSNARRYK